MNETTWTQKAQVNMNNSFNRTNEAIEHIANARRHLKCALTALDVYNDAIQPEHELMAVRLAVLAASSGNASLLNAQHLLAGGEPPREGD